MYIFKNKFLYLFITSFVGIFLFAFNVFAVNGPTYESRPTADQVLVIYNSSYTTDSDSDGTQDSQEVAEYYAQERPGAHIVGISAPTTESITEVQYNSIKSSLETYLTESELKDSIKYIVLAYGMPLRIVISSDHHYVSMEAEICLLFQEHDSSAAMINPYYNIDKSFSKIYRFKSDYFQTIDNSSNVVKIMYLTTRLDGLNISDVKAIIDRAVNAPTSTTAGYFILDDDRRLLGTRFDGTIRRADTNLKAFNRNVLPDPLPTDTSTVNQPILTSPGPVMGYLSWGYNSYVLGNGYITNNPETANHLNFDSIANGAIFSTYESYNGLSYLNTDSTVHGLVAEWDSIGGSGGLGHVDEPYTSGMADAESLFTNYAYGYNFADAAYMSLPKLDWVNTINGDPLMEIVDDLNSPSNITNFSALIATTTTEISWINPEDSDFMGVKIVRNQDHYPQNVYDGVVVYDGNATSYSDSILGNGTYYSAFTYDNVPNYSATSSDAMTRAVDVTAPLITGISDDFMPKNSKTWTWDSDDNGATYRYLIDQSADTVPSGEYSDVKTASQLDGDGVYYIHVQAKDSEGNESTYITTALAYLDNTAPVITILGSNPQTIHQGENYIDSGVTAIDNIDGDVSDEVMIVEDLDTQTIGTYHVTYSISDLANNSTSSSRTIRVVSSDPDITPPIITIKGTNPKKVYQNSVYNDMGATAYDEIDGDMSSSIVQTGSVDTSIIGTYYITYTITDSSENATSSIRIVEVVSNDIPPEFVLDEDFPITDGEVWATTYDETNGMLYVAGDFSSIGGEFIPCLARINTETGLVDTSFKPYMSCSVGDDYIDALTVYNKNLYVGGYFSSIGGENINSLARINTETGLIDTSFVYNIDGGIDTFIISDNNIYFSGDFSSVDDNDIQNLARINIQTGILDSSFAPNPDSETSALVVFGDNLYVGGYFSSIGGENINSLARINTETGLVDTSFATNPDISVNAFAISDNDLYVGGSFSSIGGEDINGLARINTETGLVDTSFVTNPSQINRLIILGNDLYVGGSFSSIGGESIKHLARVNMITGLADTSFSYNPESRINTIFLYGDSLYVGGHFRYIDENESIACLASFNVKDITPPTIIVLGQNPASVYIGDSYSDAGATATDTVDGTVTTTVISNDLNTSTIGTYTITYSATDTAGNISTSTRTINVISRPGGGGGGSPWPIVNPNINIDRSPTTTTPIDLNNDDNKSTGSASTTLIKLFKYNNDPKVYLLENGKKRWIKDEYTFNALGYKWNDVQVLDNSNIYQSDLDLSLFQFTKQLKPRSTGNDVIQLQTLLKKLGFFTYKEITNFFGQQTYNALIKFQKANKLKQTGMVDLSTIPVLNKILNKYINN